MSQGRDGPLCQLSSTHLGQSSLGIPGLAPGTHQGSQALWMLTSLIEMMSCGEYSQLLVFAAFTSVDKEG